MADIFVIHIGDHLVNYALLSPLLITLKLVNDFKTLPFDLMLSDVHCGVYISMYCHPAEPAMPMHKLMIILCPLHCILFCPS